MKTPQKKYIHPLIPTITLTSKITRVMEYFSEPLSINQIYNDLDSRQKLFIKSSLQSEPIFFKLCAYWKT